MFDHKHYVPILKAKEGEFKALEVTTDSTKDLMTPLLEIVEIPWNYDDEVEAKDINSHLVNVAKKTLDGWGIERPIFIDSNSIESERLMNDGTTHHMEFLFSDFRLNKIQTIPVTGLNKHQRYKEAVRQIKNADERGICIRLTNADIGDPALLQKIDTDLAYYGVASNEVDIILDFDHIGNTDARLLSLLLMTTINNTIPYINDWRTLTFASTAFPIDLSDIAAGTFDTIERTEWIVWNILLDYDLNRIPTFGDYSIANPEIIGMNPKFMTVSANIRYTSDDCWLIARGRGTKRFGYEQYHSLSEELINRNEYSGPAFSWGDNYINECAARRVGTGNQTIWRKVANNHHLEKTVNQISNLI